MAVSPPPNARDGFLRLVFASALVGGATGVLVSLFRAALEQAELRRVALAQWRHEGFPAGMIILVLGAGVAVGVAAWAVQRLSPHASGSGIPQVEAELEGTLPPPSLMLIPVKFVGGILAIGSGLLLGREGPSVQMGAASEAGWDGVWDSMPQRSGCCWPPERRRGWPPPLTPPLPVRCSSSRNWSDGSISGRPPPP